MNFLLYLVTEYRTTFTVLFLLPLSVLFNTYLWIRNKLVFFTNSAPLKHKEKVQKVQDQVKEWNKEGRKVPMCTARPGWMAMSLRQGKYKKTHKNIDVNLMDILEINTEKKIIRVQPLVTMGQLTSNLLPLGYTLAIVPELDDLTVGGLLMGFGVETTSHRYGLFQHICVAFEVVLADGSYVRCTKTENPELFYALPWSHGTLGFLVAAELQIIPATKYIKLEYRPLLNRAKAFEEFEKESRNTKNEFIEMLAFSREEYVLMIGSFSNNYVASQYNPIGNWYQPWFFDHVSSYLKKGPGVEYIPLQHYYHRHSRSLFWEIRDVIPYGNHPIFRYLLGWAVPPKIALLKLTQPAALQDLYEKHHCDQDFLVPITKLSGILDITDSELNMFPVWLCPMRIPNTPIQGFLRNVKDDLYVDVGTYGVPGSKSFEARKTVRQLEKWCRDNQGYQALYADTYMTREEFEDMFDHKLYNEMRQKYKCDGAFPTVYEKVNKRARV